MGSTATQKDKPAGAAVALRKRSDRELTQMWCEMTQAIDGLKGPRDEVGKILLERAEKTGKRTFYDRIAVMQSGGSLVLDQGKVIEFLIARGQVLRDFQKRTKLGLTLKLLR